MLKRIVPALAAALLAATQAVAGVGGDATRQALYDGSYASGIAALTPLAAGGDQEAKFGLGTLQFLSAVEGVVQALYRHGIAAPETGPLGPVLGIPVPANANPEPLDYGKFRAILSGLVEGMDAARDSLVSAGESGDYVVTIEPALIRMDVNGDGTADDNEVVAAVIESAFGGDPTISAPPPPDLFTEPAPGTGRKDKSDKAANAPPPPPPPVPEKLEIGFDRADAFWLAGYSQVFAAQADYLLAHDFSDLFNVAFHRLFPRAGLLMQQYTKAGTLMLDPETDAAIADAVAAIHTLNWPVVEPERLKGVLTRLQAITQLSRKDWDAILLETDNQDEFLPSPTQSTTMADNHQITEEMVAAWRETLDTVDKVLAGELLLPHWRFTQGFDLKAYFETAIRTDLVMILTGAGAIPFLKDGPIADANAFDAGNRVFGTDFINFAIWFN
jgi:hypothetical protein